MAIGFDKLERAQSDAVRRRDKWSEDGNDVGAASAGVGVVLQTDRRATPVRCEVDASRMETMRNHTATHLMNWALREVLGLPTDAIDAAVQVSIQREFPTTDSGL